MSLEGILPALSFAVAAAEESGPLQKEACNKLASGAVTERELTSPRAIETRCAG